MPESPGGLKAQGQSFTEQCDCPVPLGCGAVALPIAANLFLIHSWRQCGLGARIPQSGCEGPPWMGGGGPFTTLHRSRAGSSLAGEPSQEAGDEGPLCIIKVTECQRDVFMLFQGPSCLVAGRMSF